MLVLTRKVGESIKIDGPCVISFNWIRGQRTSIGIEADRSVKVLRTELEAKATEPEGSQECGEPRAA